MVARGEVREGLDRALHRPRCRRSPSAAAACWRSASGQSPWWRSTPTRPACAASSGRLRERSPRSVMTVGPDDPRHSRRIPCWRRSWVASPSTTGPPASPGLAQQHGGLVGDHGVGDVRRRCGPRPLHPAGGLPVGARHGTARGTASGQPVAPAPAASTAGSRCPHDGPARWPAHRRSAGCSPALRHGDAGRPWRRGGGQGRATWSSRTTPVTGGHPGPLARRRTSSAPTAPREASVPRPQGPDDLRLAREFPRPGAPTSSSRTTAAVSSTGSGSATRRSAGTTRGSSTAPSPARAVAPAPTCPATTSSSVPAGS